MIQRKINSLSLRFFENLMGYEEIGHFVSTRTSGHSSPPFHSLNLSFNVGDNPKDVLKNRKLLTKTLDIPLTGLTTAKQVHGSDVKIVSEALQGKGSVDYNGAISATDAMVTNVPNTCLMIFLADCVPVMFYDPSKGVIGVAHAGWKGTLGLVAQKTVEVFRQGFGCAPEDIFVGIGPSIGPCCCQVGQEVVSQVEHAFGANHDYIRNKTADGKAFLDLWTANSGQLVQAGIDEKNIEMAEICTCHHPDVFFSHRSEKGKTGRMGAGIVIRDQAFLSP